MEREAEAILVPMSPNSQYLSTSTFSVSVIAVLESEIPIDIDDSQAFSLVRDIFLPINPRFSSIVVVNDKGKKQWKKVEVNIKDHIKVPIFSPTNSTKLYDDSLNEYLSKIALKKFQENKPLWDIHLIKYPTKEAAGNFIFRLHHSLGDGFSLMGALLSCLKRAENPSLPLAFPSAKIHPETENNDKKIFKIVPKVVSSIYNTLSDFCSSIGTSCGIVEDDISPIRSGHYGVEFLPTTSVTMSFSLDSIKQIKNKLRVTINDVLSGTISLAIRLYMEATYKGSGNARATSLVLFNTRIFREYKSIQEMLKPNSEESWGNNFTFLPVSIPKLDSSQPINPLTFVWEARNIIQRKRISVGTFLTGKFLQLVGKARGPEEVAKYIHGTLKYTSVSISNMMGPIEHMTLANHPIKGLYFSVNGAPQSLVIGVVSYNGRLRLSAVMEKEFMDPDKFKLSVENAFNLIFEAAFGL